MSDEWLKDLKKAYIFSTLNPEELNVVAAACEVRNYEPGDTIFTQGEKPEAFFIVRYGTVKTEAWVADSQNDEGFSMHGSGAVFGDASLLSHSPRVASATIIEKTELIRVAFDKLTFALDGKPTVAIKVYKALAWHLGIMFEKSAKEIVSLRSKARAPRHG